MPQGPAVLSHSCLFQMRGIISSHLTGDVGSMKNEKPFKFSVPKKEENGLLSLMKKWISKTRNKGRRDRPQIFCN
jgi:hypothetical protein